LIYFFDQRICAIEAHVEKTRKPNHFHYIYDKNQENSMFFTSSEDGFDVFFGLVRGHARGSIAKIKKTQRF